MFVAAITALVAACGDDSGGATGNDGGSPESSTKDGPGGEDGNTPPADGGGGDADADAPFVESCDGGEPGTLDTTFGDSGLVWLTYAGSGANGVTVQPDGKLVVAGYTAANAAVVRLLANGAMDTAFGTSGLVETKPGDSSNFYNAVALQADGKVVAAGSAGFNARAPDFAVVRYLTSGGLDPTFGNSGIVLTDFSARDDYAQSVAVQADGRILVAGYSESNAVTSTSDYAVARYNSDGSLDTTFGTGGKVLVDVHGTQDAPGVLALLGGGGAVVAGTSAVTTSATSPNDFSAVELTANGTLAAFVDAGVFISAYGSAPLYPRIGSVALDGSGRIVLGGTVPGNGTDFGLVRLTSGGVFDTTFGDAGVVTSDFGGRSDGVSAVLVQPDGKIVAVGGSTAGTSTGAIALARYSSAGAPDTTFASGSLLTSPPANADLGANGATLDGCGIVVVGWWSYDNNAIAHSAMGVARYRR